MTTSADPTTRAPWTDQIFVGGSFQPPAAAGTQLSYEKATGEPLGSVGVGDADDVAAAAEAARVAQVSWAALPPVARAAALRRVHARLLARSDEVAEAIQRETGGIRFKADLEIRLALAHLEQAAALATRPLGHEATSILPGRKNFVNHVPLGVVGIITPWNLPLSLAFSPTAPALALGNTVVLKPAPHTPISGGLLIADLFREADVPPGVFNVVPGGDVVGAALVEHPDVDMIRFTGSTEVGRHIARSAGGRLQRVSLELGGNAALVVLDDADPEVASMVGAWSSFHFQGQTCITAGRHIVLRAVADAYIEMLTRRAKRLVVGDPMRGDVDMGPMIDARQLERAHGLLRASVDMGATVVEGGTYDGLFYRPTVVTGVTPDMPVFREEVFGPIAPIVVVDTEEEALALTNATAYGLSNAVMTSNPWRGLRFAEQVHSGMVHVNDTTCLSEATIPFGGWGDSSLGVPTGGDANIEQYTERRWISVQEQPPQYRY
jgi:benzaldehyde dehydrogenase (NAD)